MGATAILTLGLAIVFGPAIPAGQQSADEAAVRQRVEDFLRRLGGRQVETLAADFVPKAVMIVSRQRDTGFTNTVQTAEEWLASLRGQPNAQPFQEPISNVKVTIDSGHLAHLRADFEVVRDGRTLSRGVDQFTLVREPDGWKIAVVAYTSLPAN